MTRLSIFGVVILVLLGIGSLTFVVSKCGAKGLLYGNGAMIVAASGACD
jgi:hypothetical protein|tara:strand:+ start:1314 stop:1460 length:147 start_codon:yes stop_codon:yes gene_type:complete